MSRYGHVGITPVRGTSPNVGFIPTTPVNCAGIRFEPPSSVPSAAKAIPLATATAEPALDPPGRARAGRVVRVEHLAGVAARAVAAIGEIVGGGLAEDDRTGGAQPRDLERVAPHGIREEPRPLGARAGGREPGHVVDRLGEHRNAVERPAQSAGAQPRVGGAGFGRSASRRARRWRATLSPPIGSGRARER